VSSSKKGSGKIEATYPNNCKATRFKLNLVELCKDVFEFPVEKCVQRSLEVGLSNKTDEVTVLNVLSEPRKYFV
jgi:hypothetical protein